MPSQLTHAEWGKVVLVAGIGTVLEWFDFYTYTQLNATLEQVFFPSANETMQAISFWGVYAAAFVVRPLGGVIFGHIGDTAGRNRCLMLSIFLMALATVAIGALPTHSVGPYRAGVFASVMLALLRLVQGLAMGGEFGSAVIYISELAGKRQRGLFVGFLQLSAHMGMVLATLLVVTLQRSLTEEAMLTWGWRIPFLCAFVGALVGALLRRGMPEPHAFLTAARAAKERVSGAGSEGTQQSSLGGAATDVDVEIVSGVNTRSTEKSMFLGDEDAADPAAVERRKLALESAAEEGAADAALLAEASEASASVEDGDDDYAQAEATDKEAEAQMAKLAGDGQGGEVRTPIMRLIKSNLLGLLLHVMFMAWVSGAFYITCSWLAKDLRTHGYPLLTTQVMLVASLGCNAVGLLSVGYAIDRGLKALFANVGIVTVGVALGFAVFPGVAESLRAAWALICIFHLVIGGGMAVIALPCTRIYEPLQRTTGFSLGYNTGYGVIGGLSPLIVSTLKAKLPHELTAYAPAIWLMGLGAVSLVGSAGLHLYRPRLGRSSVGKLE